jgi:hypothetical protein
METKKKTTAKAKTTKTAKATGIKKEHSKGGGWYMDKNGKIPLSEFFKDDPKPTGPKRSDVFKKQGRWPLITEIVDMRAVMK